jgi:hypothetical protein
VYFQEASAIRQVTANTNIIITILRPLRCRLEACLEEMISLLVGLVLVVDLPKADKSL